MWSIAFMYLFSPYRRLKNVSISLEETRWMFPIAIMSVVSNKAILVIIALI